jgi:nucleotide-binding universal stress UspA family protein
MYIEGDRAMKPFQKILVPTDFSACSKEATLAAIDLARRYEAELCLVNVYEPIEYALPTGYPLFLPGQLEGLVAEHGKQLERAKREAIAAGAQRVTSEQLTGVTASELIHFAEKGKFDLIVMGTHGRTGISHALLGSVTEKIVRRAPCPVLTIRSPEKS